MPSVLVEAGFLSNNSEANYLKSDEGQEHIAISVFEAFKKFRNRSVGAPNTKSPVILASTQVSKDMLPNQEKNDEKIKVEEKPRVEVVEPTTKIKKAEPEKASPIVSAQPTEVAITTKEVSNTTTNEYFSVQIGANTRPVEPVAANFKGLKNVRREKDDQFYRYYVGNENSLDNISSIHKQIKQKFPQAFIVSFVNGKRVPLNVGSK
jgi:N-acetylmuramoyl-L-alanine amidase